MKRNVVEVADDDLLEPHQAELSLGRKILRNTQKSTIDIAVLAPEANPNGARGAH